MKKVAIRVYPLRISADLAKLRLDSLGIKSEVYVVDGVFSGVLGGFELRVDFGQSERALRFIEEYEKMLESEADEHLFDDFEEE